MTNEILPTGTAQNESSAELAGLTPERIAALNAALGPSQDSRRREGEMSITPEFQRSVESVHELSQIWAYLVENNIVVDDATRKVMTYRRGNLLNVLSLDESVETQRRDTVSSLRQESGENVDGAQEATQALERIKTVTVTPKIKFNASEIFQSESYTFGGREWDIGNTFQSVFLGRIEQTSGEPVEIHINALAESMVTGSSLVKVLGTITLPEFAAMMERQPKCESGDLLTDGRLNVAYILDENEVPWAVYCVQPERRQTHWSVDAAGIENPGALNIGGQFLSHKS